MKTVTSFRCAGATALRWAQLLHRMTSGSAVTGCSVKDYFQIYYRDSFAPDTLFL
jgi:hypothetical protein